ncbi:conjugal transfer protein TraG N-terminal domain-containing protein, partial [Acidithiobacillus sp.]|uniref:conjugal transfer protein TraG N-terminal domain-containing protein n=1 Tax=Acidithiobacillus sp. TaxID=1872118 RepID=UPI003D08A5CD
MYTPTIYILGSATAFRTLLEGMQAIFDPTYGVTAWAGGNGPFPVGDVIKIAMILGLFIHAGRMMVTQQGEVRHFVVSLLLYLALFVPTTSVVLYNIYDGDSYPINGIPIGIAYPAGFISTLSYDAMNTLSQVDNLYEGNSNPLSLAQDGYVGPLRELMSIQRLPTVMESSDPNLWYSMVAFVKNCSAGYSGFSVQNDVDNTQSKYSVFTTIFGANGGAGAYNTSSSTPIFDKEYPWSGGPGGFSASCSEAATYLSKKLGSFFGNQTGGPGTGLVAPGNDLNDLVAKLVNNRTYNDYSVPGTNTQNASNVAPTVESNISRLFPSCSTTATQQNCVGAQVGLEFMKNEIEGCAAKVGEYEATASGSQMDMEIASLPGFCTTMSGALAHQEVTNAGMASMFLAFVGPLMTDMQFLFFALAPLMVVVFAFLGPGGPSYLGKYILFGAWTQSFLPVAAILNNLAQYDAVSQLQRMIAPLTAGGNTAPLQFAQFANMSTVFSYASRSLSTADMLLAFTPLITGFLFTGSYFALTQLGNAMVSKESLGKNQDAATPNMGATTYNAPIAGYGMTSNMTGGVMSYNAAAEASPTVNLSSMVSSGASAA